MTEERTITAAFTGHRTYRGEAGAELRHAVEELYARGCRIFLSGMAAGFDLAAAEAVVTLRARRPEVRLVAVIPFEGQERRFPLSERERFLRMRAAADRVVVLAPEYRRGCYAVRNDWLVGHSSCLVAWYDGSAGGTRYTVRRALALGREVRNLHPAARVTVRPVPPTLFG